MKCPRCKAYMTIGGDRTGPVGTRTEIEAHAWAMNETVKCWCCGYEYRPTRKPSDRLKLRMGKETESERYHKSGLIDFYRRIGEPLEVYRRRVRGRKIA